MTSDTKSQLQRAMRENGLAMSAMARFDFPMAMKHMEHTAWLLQLVAATEKINGPST